MSLASKNIFRAGASLAALGAVILLGYQNCMQLPEEGIIEPSSEAGPFPFTVRGDTYGFMACYGQAQYDSNVYFSSRVGALDKNQGYGVGLNSEFKSWASTKNLTRAQQKAAIESNYKFTEPLVQGARRNSSLGLLYPNGSSSIQHVDRLFNAQTIGSFLQLIMDKDQQGKKVSNVYGQQLVAQVRLNNESLESIQNKFQGNYFTLGFEAPSDDPEKPGPLVDGGPYFGRSYQITGFKSPSNRTSGGTTLQTYGYHGQKVLAGVQEVNTESPTGGSISFNCPLYGQYKIIVLSGPTNPGVAASGPALNYCLSNFSDVHPDFASLPQQEKEAYYLANKILNAKGDYWTVDQKNRCIIRKQTEAAGYNSCYPEGRAINWEASTSSACDTSDQNPGQQLCPRYFSLCASANLGI